MPSVTGCLLPTVTRPLCGHIFKGNMPNNASGLEVLGNKYQVKRRNIEERRTASKSWKLITTNPTAYDVIHAAEIRNQ